MEYNHHIPVLFHETIEMLAIKPDGIYVDGTTGRASHAQAIYERLNEHGLLICIDQDLSAIEYAKKVFNQKPNVIIVHDNFANLKNILKDLNIDKIDGLLLDLGVSSPQLDDPTRGFSYQHDGPLDMRMNQDQTLSASEIVNTGSKGYLINIFEKYGEIRNSHSVVNAILNTRKNQPITTTFQLVDLIKANVNKKELFTNKHPARKYFQALRIAVNKEFEVLENVLQSLGDIIRKDGVVAIITFHSLEDNIVLHNFRDLSKTVMIPGFNIPEKEAQFCLINKKPIVASDTELDENNRSRSAKLRGVRKIRE